MDEAALVECALTWCPVLKGLPTFSAPHRRAAHDPKAALRDDLAANGRNGGYLTFAVTLADGVVAP
jgi:hypothetical protein